MTTPCETQAPERDSYRETIAALERRLDEVRGERDRARAWAVRWRGAAGIWRSSAWMFNWRWAARQWSILRTIRHARRARALAAPRGDGR